MNSCELIKLMNGTHSTPSTTSTPVAARPKFTSCRSLACGAIFL